MTDDPRVEAVARAICLSRPAPACDCRDRCRAIPEALKIHYPQARAALAAADAARALPADVAGLAGWFERGKDYPGYGSVFTKAATALTALAERAETAERERDEARQANEQYCREFNDHLAELRVALDRAETAERRLAVATEVLRRIRDRRARVKTDWTHFAAAEEYLRMLDHDRTDARAALAQITGEARDAD